MSTLAQFQPIAHGVRWGVLLAGALPGVGRAAIYEPPGVRGRHDLRIVYIDSGVASPSTLAHHIGLASTGDQLVPRPRPRRS